VRPRLAVATLVLGAASAIAMAVLYHPSFDPSHVYDGTDTRAFELQSPRSPDRRRPD
jgi:peptidoglycan/LPS O-acetylase OafA/YrhL